MATRSVATRCCGSPRARRAPNWTSFCGSARTPPKRCCARARVLIVATRRGDGVASALARGRGSGGGSESATALTRTCCVSAAPWAHAARVARPAAGSGFVPRRRPRPRRRAVLSVTGRAVLKSVVSDAHWSRTCLVACHKLLGSPSGRLCSRRRRREPTKQKAAAASGWHTSPRFLKTH